MGLSRDNCWSLSSFEKVVCSFDAIVDGFFFVRLNERRSEKKKSCKCSLLLSVAKSVNFILIVWPCVDID